MSDSQFGTTAVSERSFFLLVFFQQRIQQSLGDSEVGLPKLLHGWRELRQAALRRQIENAQRARHAKAFSLSRVDTFAIIHQQQVRME